MVNYNPVKNPSYCIDITCINERVPYGIREHIIDFESVSILVKEKRKRALMVLLDKVLNDEEKDTLRSNKHILNIDGIAHHQYAPEIKHTYFYVLY
jgi:hypothetical protein